MILCWISYTPILMDEIAIKKILYWIFSFWIFYKKYNMVFILEIILEGKTIEWLHKAKTNIFVIDIIVYISFFRQGVWIWLSGQSRIGIRHFRGGDQYRTTIWFAVTLWPRVRGTWNRTRDQQFLATISDILYIYAFKPLALLKPVNVNRCLSF